MRAAKMVVVMLITSVAASSAAHADPAPPLPPVRPAFSLATGETNAPGVSTVYGRFGWPGVDFGFQHGINEKVDAGLAFSLLYGFNTTTNTQFGIAVGAPLRATVLRRDKVDFGLSLTPNFNVYTTSPAIWGFGFPIGAILGIQVSPELRIAVGADFGLQVQFFDGHGNFVFAPQFGPAIEYYVDKQLSISLDTRFGPVINSNGGDANFGFRTQVGVAYRL
jgi:hypothetical protein